MYPNPRSEIFGALSADNDLLLAGLRRAADRANLSVAGKLEEASLSLRSEGEGVPHTHLDVQIGADRIVVTMDRQPSPAAWETIYELLGDLLSTESTPDLASHSS